MLSYCGIMKGVTPLYALIPHGLAGFPAVPPAKQLRMIWWSASETGAAIERTGIQ